MRFYVFFPLVLILALAGCGMLGDASAPITRYDQPNKPGGRLCTFQCRSASEHCSESCTLEERACMNDVQAQAIKDYEAYARERFRAHAPVDLRPRDFERTDVCAAKSCRKRCLSTFEECFQECGGTIVKNTPCQFMCF